MSDRLVAATEDTLPNAEDVAILSYELWQRSFGSHENALGTILDIDGVKTRIVGVMPRGYDVHDQKVELWLPLTLDPVNPGNRGGHFLYLIGRLTNHPNVEDLGWHGTEAVLFGGATAWVLKGLTGRARPFVTGDTTAHDFKFGGGFGNADRQSFPSGHTTAAFAAAGNAFVLRNRLHIEEPVLDAVPAYRAAMSGKPRFFPRIF